MRTRGRGSKNPKILRTSYLEAPKEGRKKEGLPLATSGDRFVSQAHDSCIYSAAAGRKIAHAAMNFSFERFPSLRRTFPPVALLADAFLRGKPSPEPTRLILQDVRLLGEGDRERERGGKLGRGLSRRHISRKKKRGTQKRERGWGRSKSPFPPSSTLTL